MQPRSTLAPEISLSTRSTRGREDRLGYSLNEQQVEQFQDQGYLAIPNFCEEAELAHLRAVFLKLFGERVGHSEGKQFDMLGLDLDADRMKQPQILNPSLFVPSLLRTAHFKNIASAARQLLGPLTQFSFDHSILKPAQSRKPTPWHQDEAHHAQGMFRYRQISFWMPLQDTPVESGCMRYIPKSHLGPVLPHRNLNDDPRVHAMECEPSCFDDKQAVIEPCKAGTVILHDGRTLHAALPNQSASTDRIAYILAFTGPPMLRESRPGTPSNKARTVRPANEERRKRWLMRGGALTAAARRVRLGLRSEPAILAMKARLLLQSYLAPKN